MFRKLLNSLFSQKQQAATEMDCDAWYDAKSAWMEEVLGPEHDMVMHAIVAYAVGGALDLYYYPRLPASLGGKGTAIATKELVESPGTGPGNRVYQAYELVMVTRQPLNLDDAHDKRTPFGRAHGAISPLLNAIARYAPDASLNPSDTMEFPKDFERLAGRCLILDALVSSEAAERHALGLMLIVEIHPEEMRWAMEGQRGTALLEKLRYAGHYPYSDLDREPVV